jgi:cyanate permease
MDGFGCFGIAERRHKHCLKICEIRYYELNRVQEMKAMELILAAMLCIFVLPSLLALVFWLPDMIHNPTPDNMGTGVELAVDVAIPWEVSIIQMFGSAGVVLVVLIAYFSKK